MKYAPAYRAQKKAGAATGAYFRRAARSAPARQMMPLARRAPRAGGGNAGREGARGLRHERRISSVRARRRAAVQMAEPNAGRSARAGERRRRRARRPPGAVRRPCRRRERARYGARAAAFGTSVGRYTAIEAARSIDDTCSAHGAPPARWLFIPDAGRHDQTPQQAARAYDHDLKAAA